MLFLIISDMHSKKEYLIHISLFVLTLITVTISGGEWVYGKSVMSNGVGAFTWEYFWKSTAFSFPFVGILLVHELGHYFMALRHKVKSTLPFFIPFWLGFLGAPSIGTFGAIIRIKSLINSRIKYFDIGIAGPLLGFVMALGVLSYGFLNLPPADYIYTIHPEYAKADFKPSEDAFGFELGQNLLFSGLASLLADPERLPVMSEVIHYPYLFAGYLALFFTALNLLPIGQLDGGHVIFGLFPKWHKKISLIAFTVFLGYAGVGLISPFQPFGELLTVFPLYLGFLYVCFQKSGLSKKDKLAIMLTILAFQYALVFFKPQWEGYQGWLFFGFLLGRVMGIRHPEVLGNRKLDKKRKVLGWIAIVIFMLCFSPKPFIIT